MYHIFCRCYSCCYCTAVVVVWYHIFDECSYFHSFSFRPKFLIPNFIHTIVKKKNYDVLFNSHFCEEKKSDKRIFGKYSLILEKRNETNTTLKTTSKNSIVEAISRRGQWKKNETHSTLENFQTFFFIIWLRCIHVYMFKTLQVFVSQFFKKKS